MDIKSDKRKSPERVLASLTPEVMDSLAELVVAKLLAKNSAWLLPKQGVGSSNLLTRSTLPASNLFTTVHKKFTRKIY